MHGLKLRFLEHDGRGKPCVRAATVAAVLTGIERMLRIVEELEFGPEGEKAASKRKGALMLRGQPEPGCYGIPLDFHAPAGFGARESGQDMLDIFSFFLSSVKEGSADCFIQKFGSKAKTLKMLREMNQITKLCSENESVALQCKGNDEFDFYGNKENIMRAEKAIKAMMGNQMDQDSENCIIAKLVSVDLQNHVLHFEHSSEKISLAFKYDQDDLDLRREISRAFGSRNNILELHGDMKFTEDGSPCEITSLTKLKEVDLGRVVVREVTTAAGVIAPDRPLVFQPELDESRTIYVVDASPFADDLYETTRGYLVEEISDHLSCLWNLFAMEKDERLDSGGMKIKNLMLEKFKLKDG